MKKKKSKKKTSFISKTAMTVLTIILIILFFCIMSMVEKIQGTARVVNYAGLVRGKTQRIIINAYPIGRSYGIFRPIK